MSERLWWQDDSEIRAITQSVLDEIARASKKPDEEDKPDEILEDVLNGNSVRELGNARDDLARARTKYVDAVRNARRSGFSWGEIARILGVSRQYLHRRFHDDEP